MLEVGNLRKDYGDLRAVNDISFEIDQGEFTTLLGPSGCGKSTTLHMIAGLTKPTKGDVHLRGTDITNASPSARDIGLVFQNTALFPHMTTAENLAYGLKMHGWEKSDIDDRVTEMLELVQLPEHGDHYPDELSGGQQQRVAFARSIAYEPDMLLLDEPLTGLDRVLREEMRKEIRRIQREVDLTTLYVTHDQEEALSLSDKVVVLNDGDKQQEGTPREIYQKPANEFVAEFVGKSTKFTGTVSASSTSALDIEGGSLYLPKDVEQGRKVSVYIRPSDIGLGSDPSGSTNEFEGEIVEVTNLGTRAEVLVDIGSTDVLIETERFPHYSVGDTVYVEFNSEDMIIL